MRQYVIFLLVMGAAVWMTGCTPQEVVVNNTRVEKLLPGTPPGLQATDYALPRTVIGVEIVVEKTVTKPGPFAAYAERYLGVTEVPTRELTEYRILEVRLKTRAERDPDQVYRIFSEGVSPAGRIGLNQQGVLTGINMPPLPADHHLPAGTRAVTPKKAEEPGYPDLTLRKNTEPMLDTIYRVVRTDTSFMRLPLLESQISQKNLSNQAEEAANVIMKLRKRRFYLMTGEYAYRSEVRTPMPEGGALEVIVRELAQMEYDYVSLFVGRTLTSREIVSFSFVPDGEGSTETDELFVFSRFRGILPAGNSNGDPVRITLDKTYDPKDMYTTADYELSSAKTPVNKGVAYRIPGKARVSLILNNEQLVSQELLIAQYGVVQFLPASLFENTRTAIEFHPELGLVKNIFSRQLNE